MEKLTIELVPRTCWFSNVRDHVERTIWDKLRRQTYKDAGYTCQICGGTGSQWPVECHEIWHYDDNTMIQRLGGLIALCPACHRVKHMGLARIHGKAAEATKHLAEINAWTIAKAQEYITAQFELWRTRSTHEWQLDLAWLAKCGLQIKPKKRK